jgi:uncharacterized protein (DUF697 family)
MVRKSNSDRLRARLAESLDTANGPVSVAPPPSPAIVPANMSATEIPAASEPTASRKTAAERIVLTSTMLGAGAGALPIPVWDAIAVTGVQLKMLADLSALYGVPFTDNLGKSAVASLVGGLAPGMLAHGTFGIFFKTLPGLGSLIGAAALPALAGGCTYAVGQVFVRHYESGGTLLTFSAKDFQAGFTEEVKAGMKKVAAIKI